MASKECFHFTKLKYLYSIRNDGLLPKLDINSKAVGDTKPKISFSDSRVGAVGLFLEFNRVYNDYKSGKRIPDSKKIGETEMFNDILKSESLQDFLGEGVYLTFDGTGIENEGGNTGKGGIYDASTCMPIESSKLKVGLIRNNDTKHVSYSMYDYINYLMVNLKQDEILQMPDKMQNNLHSYIKEHEQELSELKNGNYSLKEVDLDTFCKICKSDIDKNINMDKDIDDEVK